MENLLQMQLKKVEKKQEERNIGWYLPSVLPTIPTYSSEPQKKNHDVKNARLCKGLVFTESNTEKR